MHSLEGSLAFVVSAAVATVALLLVFSPLGVGAAVTVALAAAVAGAVAELVSLRVDDNFSIPLSAAAGVALATWALGLPL